MSNKSYSIGEIRKKYRSAYSKWTAEDEATLVDFLKQGIKCSEIATKMGRQKGAISSRIRKINLRSEHNHHVPGLVDKSVESEQN